MECLKFSLFGIPWDLNDASDSRMLTIYSVVNNAAGLSATVDLGEKGLGPIWAKDEGIVFWKSSGIDGGWDGTKIIDSRTYFKSLSSSQKEDYLKTLQMSGWSLTESQIDSVFRFASGSVGQSLSVDVGIRTVVVTLAGGPSARPQNRAFVTVDGKKSFDWYANASIYR